MLPQRRRRTNPTLPISPPTTRRNSHRRLWQSLRINTKRRQNTQSNHQLSPNLSLVCIRRHLRTTVVVFLLLSDLPRRRSLTPSQTTRWKKRRKRRPPRASLKARTRRDRKGMRALCCCRFNLRENVNKRRPTVTMVLVVSTRKQQTKYQNCFVAKKNFSKKKKRKKIEKDRLRERVSVELTPFSKTIKQQLLRTSNAPSCSATFSIALSSRCLAPPIHPSLLSLSFSSFRRTRETKDFSIFRREILRGERGEKKRGNIKIKKKNSFICSSLSLSFGFLSPVSLSLSGLRPRTNREREREREREFVTPRSLLVFFVFLCARVKECGELNRYERIREREKNFSLFFRFCFSWWSSNKFSRLSFNGHKKKKKKIDSIRFD